MRLNKELFSTLNEVAKTDFDRAKAMLDGINLVLGTKYGWLCQRVTYFDDDSTIASKYATAHDAWLNAEE